MKIGQILEKVYQYHPAFPADYDGCDGLKYGDPDTECTGIATALVPTADAILKARAAGCNLLYVHEPTNFTSLDKPGWDPRVLGFENKVYEAKEKLIRDSGMAIFRDHDHMHAHRPDSVFTGVIKYLGWEDYYRPDAKGVFMGYTFDLPETTVGELARFLMSKLPMNGVRFVGNAEDKIRRVAIVGHLIPGFGKDGFDEQGVYHEYGLEVIKGMEEAGIDCVIPGEVIEWTTLAYIKDAVTLGFKAKACINIGHFSMEELGAAYCRDWLEEITGGRVPVTYIPGVDTFRFMLAEG